MHTNTQRSKAERDTHIDTKTYACADTQSKHTVEEKRVKTRREKVKTTV